MAPGAICGVLTPGVAIALDADGATLPAATLRPPIATLVSA
jgi:hypothetical protein